MESTTKLVDLKAMKRQGWNWIGGVYTGLPHLKSSEYLGDLWKRGPEIRLAHRVEYGFAESFDPMPRGRITRGPTLRLSASRIEDRWIWAPAAQEVIS